MTDFASVVLVEPSLSHLGRAFTYALPPDLPLDIGAHVRVPFRGKRRRGIVVELLDETDVEATLPVADTLGPGLDADLVSLARWVADRYLATLGEALAAVLPQRIASEERSPFEAEPARAAATPALASGELEDLEAYPRGRALIASVREGTGGGFVVRPHSEASRGRLIAGLVAAARARGAGALVLVPEVRVGGETVSALRDRFGDEAAWLGSDRSARERYRDWLALRGGRAGIAIGARGAVFAPVPHLGLIVVDDEAHASYKEGRAPRFHARTVAAERARRAGATLVLIGSPPSIEARAAAERRPYTLVAPTRDRERSGRPPVSVIDDATRLEPGGRTLTMARRVLEAGERVVFLVHRSGEDGARVADRTIRILGARSPVRLDASSPPADLRRAVRSGDCVIATPVVAKDLTLERVGLLAIVGVDAVLAQPAFRAAEEAFATWWRAARWAAHIAIETRRTDDPAVQALIRWDADVLYRAEAARRRELRYPPFASVARIDVPADRAAAAAAEVTGLGVEVLGPVDGGDGCVIVVRAERRDALLSALRPVVDAWRRRDEPMRVDVDPWEVLVPKWRS